MIGAVILVGLVLIAGVGIATRYKYSALIESPALFPESPRIIVPPGEVKERTLGQAAYEAWAFGWEADPERYWYAPGAKSQADPWAKLHPVTKDQWELVGDAVKRATLGS